MAVRKFDMICGLHSVSIGSSYSKKTLTSSPGAVMDARLVLLLKTTVDGNEIYEAVLFRHLSKGSVVLWSLREGKHMS